MAPPSPTPRLSFREMTPDDLDDMAGLLGDPEVMRYYRAPKRRDEALAWIHWNQRLYREHGFGLWLLTLRGTGEFVGDCGLTPQQVDGETEIEVGYHVRSALQGRGLATEAATACRDHARDVLRPTGSSPSSTRATGPPSASPRSLAWCSSGTPTTMGVGPTRSASTPRRSRPRAASSPGGRH